MCILIPIECVIYVILDTVQVRSNFWRELFGAAPLPSVFQVVLVYHSPLHSRHAAKIWDTGLSVLKLGQSRKTGVTGHIYLFSYTITVTEMHKQSRLSQ